MASGTPSVVSIGECMVELARGSDGRFGLAYGGDTFNTAVYLARAGLAVHYATALGDDPYSDGIAALAGEEGLICDLITRKSGRMPGLYLIETTPAGERSFQYWREQAPAREVFDGPVSAQLIAALDEATLIYFSGITLSLYTDAALDAFAVHLERARRGGTHVAMDGNYRPRGWRGNITRARAVMQRFWTLADIALPTFDDEQALWGDRVLEETIARLRSFHVRECVIKRGADGAVIALPETQTQVACPAVVQSVDTTAAGDSFNAGYLARRLAGDAPETAAVFAHRLAGIVIQHRGAIVPRAATASLFG
jgi:2-dehydro-3-deoxygluconokinase